MTRHIPLDGTHNTRDLGGYATPTGPTAWRAFLRSDGLDRLTDPDHRALDALGVRTVIDLRHDEELETAPNPFARSEHVTYAWISLLRGLDPASPRIIDDADPLRALYLETLDRRGDAIVEIFAVMAAARPGAILFHCTAGKDRTGVIAALLLSLAGVSPADIVTDYALTTDYIAPIVAGLRERATQEGRDFAAVEPFLSSAPQTMRDTLAHLETRYGTAADYLAAAGLSRADLDSLRERLLAQPLFSEA
ncbi:MAG: tyrosine-protein phosphatase [Rhodobacter sp.]|nr:tyrosine-protein phosphatase [Paracoccaceae bacterium]MCC0077105.1 tyrosine-protein phosphatase [Rhodobacter sp.]